jgi:transposase
VADHKVAAKIHALSGRGLTIAAIADQLRLNRTTVRKFVRVSSAADLRRTTGQGPRGLDGFTPYLVRRWREGCQTAAYLHNEVEALGYNGSKRTVRRFGENWRKTKAPQTLRRVLPGRQTLCWLLLRRHCELDDAERVLLTELCRRSSELATSRLLAQRFMVLVRERRGTQLEQWIADVQTTGPPELRGFSRNLHRDWLAVQAGFTVHFGCMEFNHRFRCADVTAESLFRQWTWTTSGSLLASSRRLAGHEECGDPPVGAVSDSGINAPGGGQELPLRVSGANS